MKNRSIQTKRDTGRKGGLKILHARTRSRKKQHAVAATPEDLGADVPNVGIGRALLVILVLHVIAIGAVFMHTSWTSENQEDSFTSATPTTNTDSKNTNSEKLSTSTATLSQAKTPVIETTAVEVQPTPVEEVLEHSVIPTIANALPEIEAISPVEVVKPVKVKPNGSILIYKVQPGDTVWGICKKNKISESDLKTLNGLTSNNIRVGQKLKIRK